MQTMTQLDMEGWLKVMEGREPVRTLLANVLHMYRLIFNLNVCNDACMHLKLILNIVYSGAWEMYM